MNILHEYLSAALIKVELLVEVKWTSCRLLKPDAKSLSGKVFIYFTRAMPKSTDFTESYQYQSLNIFYIWWKKLYIFIFALIWAVMWVWLFLHIYFIYMYCENCLWHLFLKIRIQNLSYSQEIVIFKVIKSIQFLKLYL